MKAADQIELTATTRAVFGKKVRFLRRQGLTPANVYGHSVESVPLQIETAQLKRALARAGKTSLIALKQDGQKRPTMVIVREVQRHPLTREFLHVVLYQVRMEEKIKLQVPLVVVGTAPAVKDLGGILVQNLTVLDIECLPANMPHSIEVDISVLTEIDQAVHAKDLSVGEGITILTDPDQAVARIARARVEVEEVVKPAAAEAVVEGEAEEAEAGEAKEEAAPKEKE